MGQRVLVCGGRAYSDRERLFTLLDDLHVAHNFDALIEGGARGADRLARYWAERRRVPTYTVRADWETHGNAAGPIRNLKMLKLEPTLVVAFPGGKGTVDMVRRARAANVEVIEVAADPSPASPDVSGES